MTVPSLLPCCVISKSMQVLGLTNPDIKERSASRFDTEPFSAVSVKNCCVTALMSYTIHITSGQQGLFIWPWICSDKECQWKVRFDCWRGWQTAVWEERDSWGISSKSMRQGARVGGRWRQKRREGDVAQANSSTFAAMRHFVCQYPGRKISAEINLTAVAVSERAFVHACLRSGGLFPEINAISGMPRSPTLYVAACGIILVSHTSRKAFES